MDATQEFERLIAAARSGSSAAASELLEQYGPHVLRAVRRKLARELRPRFDSVDFTQAVWGSVFTDPELLAGVDSPEALARLLSAMAENKVVQEFRRQLQTKKRNVRRERSLNDSTIPQSERVADRQPSPSQVLIAEERWEELLATASPQHRVILSMRRGGMTHQEIANQLGVHERTIERVLSRMRPG